MSYTINTYYPPTPVLASGGGNVAPYLALIPPENANQPDFVAVMTTLMQPLADMLNVTNTIPSLFSLDTAIGQQLDFVGQWIGPTRFIEEAIPDVYFSFDILGLGFDQAVWAPNDATTALQALPDAEYRLLLYAAVARNHWDGTDPGAETALNSFWNQFGFNEYVIDNQDMTVTFLLVGPVPNALQLALFYGGYLDILAAGVGTAGPNNGHIYVEGSGGIPTVPFFGFDLATPFIAGFDIGYWSGTPVGQVWRCGMFGDGLMTAVLNVTNPDGTYGIFFQGAGSTNAPTWKFTFGSNTCVSSTALGNITANICGQTAGNGAGFVLPVGDTADTTVSWTFVADTVAAGTNLSWSPYYNNGSINNTTTGYFVEGNENAATNKYTFSGATVAAGSGLANPNQGAQACCGTFGIIALGTPTGSGYVAHTNQYVFSGDVVSTSTDLSDKLGDGVAGGNNNYGIFMLSVGPSAGGTKQTCTFTYSSLVTAAGTALNNYIDFAGCLSNSTETVINAGNDKNQIWNMSSHAVTNTTSIPGSNTVSYGGGQSNGCAGVNL